MIVLLLLLIWLYVGSQKWYHDSKILQAFIVSKKIGVQSCLSHTNTQTHTGRRAHFKLCSIVETGLKWTAPTSRNAHARCASVADKCCDKHGSLECSWSMNMATPHTTTATADDQTCVGGGRWKLRIPTQYSLDDQTQTSLQCSKKDP